MKKIKIISKVIFALFFLTSGNLLAQGKITDFKYTLSKLSNGIVITIKPLAFDPYSKDYKSKKYNYVVRICYTRKGKKLADRLDMSDKLNKDGEYQTKLASGRSYEISDVKITDIQYFNKDEIPKDKWPKKEDCF